MKRRQPALLIAAACGLTTTLTLAVSAGATASVPPDDSGPDATFPAWEPEPIRWTESIEWEGAEEGFLEVPVDYADPDGPKFNLYVTRHPAENPDERIGALLVNPGGPGFGGSIYGLAAPLVGFSDELLDRFDIIGWDPRGTGSSEPFIDCIEDYDAYYAGYDSTPDSEEERQEVIDVAVDFADQCASKNADIIQFVGTNNSARDIDTIRRAIGEEQVSWFGFSYGSELGATWATLFPETVRAAVLDGASDPGSDLLEGGLQQSAGFEQTLATYLADCSADSTCAFHNDGDAEGAFDALMLKLDQKPIPAEDDRPRVDRGVALQAAAEAMYDQATWGDLSDALADAREGDGSGLLELFDTYYQRDPVAGTWDNSLEAFQTIVCMDESERLTIEEEDANGPLFTEVAPRFNPEGVIGYFCNFYPESTDPRIEITAAGAGPIVVCGATGDAATPVTSSRNMARALEDGRLIVIDAQRHTCYGEDRCGDDIIESYLLELVVPPEETLCPGVPEDVFAEEAAEDPTVSTPDVPTSTEP